jgi:Concanavalin A-like lectin/glucanases superfamily
MGGNDTTATMYLAVDGTHVGSRVNITPPAAFTSPLYVGAFPAVSNWFDGSLGEMLIYSRVLSTTEAQDVEGYEAWKWGAHGLLPTAHPFSQYPYSCKGPAVNGQLTCT